VNVEARQARARVARAREAHEADRAPFAAQLEDVEGAYRGPKANASVGGSKTSQHMTGEAADVEVDGMDNTQLAKLVVSLKLPFDQLIAEFVDPAVPGSGWVHVSHKRGGPQRGQALRAVNEGGKTKYLPGLE